MQANREIFRAITGYENYEVSNHGRVRNVKTAKIFKNSIRKDGYESITLPNVTKYIHRLVAQEFIDNNDATQTQIDHIDHNRQNNHVSNLRYVTVKQNSMNKSKREGLSSQYKGVYFDKRSKKWVANIVVDGKRKHLGYYDNEYEAGTSYNDAAEEHFGDYAYLNEID